MTELLPSEGQPDPHDAFDALVRAHYERLCNFAYRCVESRDVAEDIVQDVFARMWRNRGTVDIASHDPLPYLYQAVRNQAVNHRRHNVVRERWRVQAVADEQPGVATVAADLEARDLAAALAAAIDELPERRRLIFTMSREQDLSYAEIARVLGISVKTVETQIGRALKTLRIRLAGYLSIVVAIAVGWR